MLTTQIIAGYKQQGVYLTCTVCCYWGRLFAF